MGGGFPIITRDPNAKKGDPDAKKRLRGFIYVDRAQTEQTLNLVHDRGLGSSRSCRS